MRLGERNWHPQKLLTVNWSVISERRVQVLRQLFNQEACTVVARPTRDEAGHWVGAASIVHDHRSGWYYMTLLDQL